MNEEVLLQRTSLVFSEETLHHFQCNACSSWWSIGDFAILRERKNLHYLHCPVCGIRQRLNRPENGCVR